MGKAASQRRIKRMKYLSRLAKSDPDRFEKEWSQRMDSWLTLIGGKAGKLRDSKGNRVAPVFEIVNEAIEVLRGCGKDTYAKHNAQTYETLANECCRQLADKIDSRLCRTNNFNRFEAMFENR